MSAQFLIDEADDRLWDSEAETLAAAALGEDEGINADKVAFAVDQWSAAVTRVDRRVGLNVNHRIVGLRLAPDSTDDALGECVIEPFRRANREYTLAETNQEVRREWDGRKFLRIDFD